MSLYPIIWAAEHAPVRDAEERAILIALVMKGDFDGCNCFRSYGTLAKVARVDTKTAGRRCREMEQRGILRRQEQYRSQAWLAIPEKQRPVVWEVMIPVDFWSAVQLDEINEQRASLGRHPLTRENRPALADAPPKKTRADKGTKRPKKKDGQAGEDPGTDSPWVGNDPEGADLGTDSPHPRDCQSPPQGLEVPQPSESPSQSPSEELAPSARSAGDARRASTGSRARAARGGSAAPEKPASSRRQINLTPDEARAVAVVERGVPESLLELLAGKTVPHTFRMAVLREMEHRTPEQLADRVARRWVRYGFQGDLLAGKGIANPYAVLQALVRAGECPDAGCEDGELIDTGADCRACEQRKADRPGKGAVPAQRSGRSWWECRICRNPKRREPEPGDGECQDCKREAAEHCAGLAASWGSPTTEDVNDR